MTASLPARVQRWTGVSIAATASAGMLVVGLAFGPLFLAPGGVSQLTTLFTYVLLAVTWNALAGYGGLVSVGQQAFFGLGAYAAIRLADLGVNVYAALLVAAVLVAIAALPLSLFMLRLRAGEFAIGMWVVAELAHLWVNLDGLIQGETGTSLIQLNAYSTDVRGAMTYWLALGGMTLMILLLFVLLRSRFGIAAQAIRDSEEAADSVGVRVVSSKRVLFIVAAFGAAFAGAIWLASAISFQPKTYFGVQWSAYMIFMVLVGGIGTFEGPIIGAVIFFALEWALSASGAWYLVGLGLSALMFSLFFPRGIWGYVQGRFAIDLLPVGYRLEMIEPSPTPKLNGGAMPVAAALSATSRPDV
ncbi:branched-chain amino acid ABC transporter permease [Bradyrhizobium liaoningense]|uniref:branched-chain amino acid ABC transporter permease n=1 Tax=Bradyrhizobium liaoningense TaxID=43992 RepID=UPI001BA5F3DF|nr:branched-chain amino acid ABC transporter permease [Bradyrhizobium liaoningense]MBR0706254.1 branched-chain amino acid ABC transporter permease [Bradyrhizobium liaoningense]